MPEGLLILGLVGRNYMKYKLLAVKRVVLSALFDVGINQYSRVAGLFTGQKVVARLAVLPRA